MDYTETYENLVTHGVSNKEEVQLMYTIRNIEKFRQELMNRGK